jgi:hypothetical protein
MKTHTKFFLIIWMGILLTPTWVFGQSVPTWVFTQSNPSWTYLQPTSTTNRLGAFVIILGDRGDHEYLDQIKYGGEQVYATLINLGFPASLIYCVGPSYGTIPSYQNATATHANIEYALTNWTIGKIDASHGLGIYLFDHGGVNYICMGGIAGSSNLPASTFNTYLNTMETNTGCNRVILVYEACRSGSFIDEVSKTNRIILTATDENHGSTVNPAGNWATFSEAFWSSIATGDTIGNAFIDACYFVVDSGFGNDQFPLIDDNHDTVGHRLNTYGTLPNQGDGSDALSTKISYSPFLFVSKLKVTEMRRPSFLNYSNPTVPVWVKFNNNSMVKNAYVKLIPPNWTPPDPITDNEGMLPVQDNLPKIPLYDRDGDGNWTGLLSFSQYSLVGAPWPKGPTRLLIGAIGRENQMTMETSRITLNNDGLPEPDIIPPTIRIKNPFANQTVSGNLKIIADGDDDQNLNSIVIKVDGTVVKNVSTINSYPYPDVEHLVDTMKWNNGVHNITATAADNAGLTASASILVEVQNTSPDAEINYWIWIIVGAIAIVVVGLMIRGKRHK